MSTSEPRIVAVTDSTALVIGLTCLPTNWDVICHPTTDAALAVRSDAAVLVLDLGSTAAGLTWITGPGEEEEALLSGSRAVVIGDSEPQGPAPAGTVVLLRPYTLPQLSETIEELLGWRAMEVSPAADVRSVSDAPPSAQLFGHVASPTAEEEAPSVPSPRTSGEEEMPATEAVLEAAATSVPDVEVAVDAEASRVVDLTRIPEATSEPEKRQHPSRTRRQRRGKQEPQLRDRLAAVLTATAELERLVEQVPMLRSVETFAAAIVADIVAQLDAATVGFWRTGADGWELAAHHGLTAHESTMHVPVDHPLFSEVDASGGSILIDPVDALLSAVAGVGGAHTESFMAAALAAGPDRFGILAVGRDQPLTEADLDVLVDIANEATPGIAVAERLARIKNLASNPEPAAAH